MAEDELTMKATTTITDEPQPYGYRVTHGRPDGDALLVEVGDLLDDRFTEDCSGEGELMARIAFDLLVKACQLLGLSPEERKAISMLAVSMTRFMSEVEDDEQEPAYFKTPEDQQRWRDTHPGAAGQAGEDDLEEDA